MSICLLTNLDYLQSWMQAYWPEVRLFSSATEGMQSFDIIMVSEYIKIDNHLYEIQSLWKEFLHKREEEKKLITVGNLYFPRAVGYFSLADIQNNPGRLLEKLPIMDLMEGTEYPALPFTNLLEVVEAHLKSHGKHNLHSLLIELKEGMISHVEELLESGTSLEELVDHKDFLQSQKIFQMLAEKWAQVEPFLSFVPQYQSFQPFPALLNAWNDIRKHARVHPRGLDTLVSEYVDTIADLLELFGLDNS